MQVLKWAHNPQAQELIKIKYSQQEEILEEDVIWWADVP